MITKTFILTKEIRAMRMKKLRRNGSPMLSRRQTLEIGDNSKKREAA
jgi:hypothetical protein